MIQSAPDQLDLAPDGTNTSAEDTSGELGMIGRCAATVTLRRLLKRVAQTNLPAVIAGEPGTGKELAARAIHAGSARAQGPFVTASCSSIPDSLLESELFGHVKGAFTGAFRAREGLFQSANGGTLFLDDMAAASEALQASLLRVLEEGWVRPVGAEARRRIDVRVVAATQEPLDRLVQTGRLREDLYYRLSVMELRVPPLRERRDDIPLLIDAFLRRYLPAGRSPFVLSDAALKALLVYSWPGNVRQLENVVRSWIARRLPRVILLRHLSPEVRGEIPHAGGPIVESRVSLGSVSLADALGAFEKDLIELALRSTGGNVAQAARHLRVGRTKLLRRMSHHGLRRDRYTL